LKNEVKIEVHCTVNGEDKKYHNYPMERLLDVLRNEGKLTGTKEGCGEGECGACSIFVEGELVNSCLIPLLQVKDKNITTIEGIASENALSKIQESFLIYGGAQCGICTPGMIMAATSLLKEFKNPTEKQIKESLAGNLCRCTGYTKIFHSVVKALEEDQN